MSTILVVDDEEQILRALRRALIARGYEVVTAADGEDALVEAEASMPDLVVLDLNLPGIDGFEVLSWIRNHSKLYNLPVTVLTSSELSCDVQRAFCLGANSFLTKPGGFQDLVETATVIQKYWLGVNAPPQVSR